MKESQTQVNICQSSADISRYSWKDYPPDWVRTDSNLNQVVISELERLRRRYGWSRCFELGCGNGSFAALAMQAGFEIVGVDPSPEAIDRANAKYPNIKLELGSHEEPLIRTYGQFPIVVSMEVIEHVFFPRDFASVILGLLEPGGAAIITTPYHGYWKNLALAVLGKMDRHFTALWDGGHIKFFSEATLQVLLTEVGFEFDIRFRRVGRVPPFAKSMVAIAFRPQDRLIDG